MSKKLILVDTEFRYRNTVDTVNFPGKSSQMLIFKQTLFTNKVFHIVRHAARIWVVAKMKTAIWKITQKHIILTTLYAKIFKITFVSFQVVKDHRNNGYRMRTFGCSYLSSVKTWSPQNGRFIRASLVVPDSYGREFRAVARSATVFQGSVFKLKKFGPF